MRLDIGFEDTLVHRRVDDERRGQSAALQAGDKGLCLPMSERRFCEEPLTFRATPAVARHLGRGSGALRASLPSGRIDEDQPLRLKPHLWLALICPFFARLDDVGPVLLAGPQSFFEAIAGSNEQRESAGGVTVSLVAATSSAASSGIVMSGRSSTLVKRNLRCGSNLALRRPPLGLGVRLPVARKALIRFTTKETDTLK